MSGFKKSAIPRQSSYDRLYANPLSELNHNRSCSDGGNGCSDGVALGIQMARKSVSVCDSKENILLNKTEKLTLFEKEKVVPRNENCVEAKKQPNGKANLKGKVFKPSSLQLCMQRNEPDAAFGLKIWEPIDSNNSNSGDIWDYSDSEAAPASSWSTLPNRSLLCRPLPVDIGRCTCVIVKEAFPNGGSLYSLYTNEGQGRQNRKLAVAHHKRRNGRSVFRVAQNTKALSCNSEGSFIGTVTANFMGTKYQIWNQGDRLKSSAKQRLLLAVVSFMPTIATWTGSHRIMKAWVPKHQSMQLKNTSQIQDISGLPNNWRENDKVHRLFSKVPHYNNISKQYELDFRDKGRAGLKIQSSVKNFQLTLEKNGKQTILQLGRVGKSKYVMDYRYPLTAYQAFCTCLASIDSKLCCSA